MIEKVENCIYCGKKMESVTAKKRFCSGKCRVYYNRENRPRLAKQDEGGKCGEEQKEINEAPKSKGKVGVNVKPEPVKGTLAYLVKYGKTGLDD